MDDYHYDIILRKGSLFAPEDNAMLIEAFSFEVSVVVLGLRVPQMSHGR